nr:hypothetical protein [Pseudovibrio ascidiaceicola]
MSMMPALRFAYRDVDVVEGRAAEGCCLIGAGEGVDAVATFVCCIGPDAFCDDG